MNQHQAVVNRLQWAQREYNLNTNDRILQKTPFSFDVSVWEFFLPLIAGAKLIIAKPDGHHDPEYLQDQIVNQAISTVHFVPSMLQVFLEVVQQTEAINLKRVLCSGEALSMALVLRFQEIFPNVELHNLYGPTEAAVDVTSWQSNAGDNMDYVPIGRPISNIQIYILDAYLNPCPELVAGQLYIGGVGLARGYFNRPDLTAERFIPNPFSTQASERLYQTGDLVRYHKNGLIEYLDRLDNQIKIRGFRIELNEIEQRLLQHPDIAQASVLVKQNENGDKQLAAYLLANSNPPDHHELKAFIKQTLPDFMTPASFIYVDAFPLTSNGKLNRNALLAIQQTIYTERPYVEPRDEIETIVAEIWRQTLGVKTIGVFDDFFDLGGHSLSAVQITNRIKQEFAIDVPARTLFEAPNIADFVEKLVELPTE